MTQYRMANKISYLFLLLFLSFGLNAQERKPVPPYIGHINDFAGVLQPSEVAQLEAKLLRYEDSTSTQIAVIVETTLNGRSEFDRAMDYARGWGVGQKDKRNGVVIYVAIEDRKFYIVTADRTQGALTDGELGEIFRTNVKANFQAKQYYDGLNNALDALISGLQGEFKADPKGKQPQFPFIIILIVIIIILAILSKRGGGGFTGGMTRGGTYWFPSSGGWIGGGGSSSGGSGGGSSWGGFGGGGGFNGGGAGGSW